MGRCLGRVEETQAQRFLRGALWGISFTVGIPTNLSSDPSICGKVMGLMRTLNNHAVANWQRKNNKTPAKAANLGHNEAGKSFVKFCN
ncbi:hypothetical protein [Leptospira weilii]|nr:hypothetical protein [Leptospira weilii]